MTRLRTNVAQPACYHVPRSKARSIGQTTDSHPDDRENVVDEHSSADIKASNWVFWVVLFGVGAVWFCLADVLLAPWLTSVGMPTYVGELVNGVVACGVLFAAPSLASRFDRRWMSRRPSLF